MDQSSNFNLDHIINIKQFQNPENLTCQTICHGILYNPIKCFDCCQHFCRDCILQWVSQDKKCPHCRNVFKDEIPNEEILSDLIKIRIKCPFFKNGCIQELNYECLKKHLEICIFRSMICNWCKKEGIMRDIEIHLNNCDLRITTCKGCKQSFDIEQLKFHDFMLCCHNKIDSLELFLTYKERLRFSSKFMNPFIKLNSEKNQATQLKDIYKISGVCILKPKLIKLKSWKIKVLSLTCWIGIGISSFNDVYAQNYTFSDYSIENMKHGGYLVSSNGIRWSSTDKNQNFQNSFKFGQEDIIEIIYNSSENKIFFKKTNSYSEHGLTVSLNTEIIDLNNFYPIVILGATNDSVKIVSSDKI